MILSVVSEIFHFYYFEVVFHWKSSSFQTIFIFNNFKIGGRSDQLLLRYKFNSSLAGSSKYGPVLVFDAYLIKYITVKWAILFGLALT